MWSPRLCWPIQLGYRVLILNLATCLCCLFKVLLAKVLGGSLPELFCTQGTTAARLQKSNLEGSSTAWKP